MINKLKEGRNTLFFNLVKMDKNFYNSSLIQSNISEIWEQRKYEDIKKGVIWYEEAKKYCIELSDKYNIELAKVAGILAALSPQKEWENNKKITEDFLISVKKSPNNGWRKGKHFFNLRKKARDIYRLDNPFIDEIGKILNGNKIYNFFNCIMNPLTSDHLCIDRHMIFVALMREKSKLTPKQYSFLKEEYLKFAKSVNIKPCQTQGILWLTYKRIKKI